MEFGNKVRVQVCDTQINGYTQSICLIDWGYVNGDSVKRKKFKNYFNHSAKFNYNYRIENNDY